MFTGKAQFAYYQSWLVAYVDKSLVNYYYSLIPKYKYAQRQMYPPHITVVRLGIEVTNKIKWAQSQAKYNGATITFTYDGLIHFKSPYYFIKVWSNDIGRIRMELGLPQYRDSFNCYHISIGNIKEK